MDEQLMLLLVTLTIAIVEGAKQFGLKAPFMTLAAVLVGGGLAAVAVFVPEAMESIVPILTVGLASAGLYSITKRAGLAVFNK